MFRVALGHVSPNRPKAKYRCYSPTSMTNAYLDVVENKVSVHKASKIYSVPEQTLRDRVIGKVEIESLKSGHGPLLSQLEEAKLVEHIKTMASVGYGYTRAEVINTASEYAVYLGKRDRDTPLKFRWFYSFMRRWPELKVQRPKTLSELRAKATSRESVNKYFEELEHILNKYDLQTKPQNIYNVDEKGIQQNFTPPRVVGAANSSASIIMSERSSTTTVFGCGSAIGHQIPPYFVFAGARMRSELLQGCSVGANGTVSKSGWSNGEVFQSYLANHFIKFATGDRDSPILLLYDGHRSHISPAIIDWANDNNIILYVLSPHTSHILQPMDVGCFGPFAKIYSDMCNKFQRNSGATVCRYNVCELACKAYTPSLSPGNLQSAFRKSGIYPYDPAAVNSELFVSNQLRRELQTESAAAEPTVPETTTLEYIATDITVEPTTPEPAADEFTTTDTTCTTTEPAVVVSAVIEPTTPRTSIDTFFKRKRPVFNPPIRKERFTISKICSGKAITEEETAKRISDHVAVSKPKKTKFQPPTIAAKSPITHSKKTKNNLCKPTKVNTQTKKHPHTSSPVPGTSGLQKRAIFYPSTDSDSTDDDQETATCCVCNRFYAAARRESLYVVDITKWGKCEFVNCDHWVHLKYCCPLNQLRRHDTFYCPCHGLPWRGTEE